MESIQIQWHALSGQWLVDQGQGSVPLAQWAQEQADLTAVRLILSARNYSTHWVTLPGVSARQLSKALPFALEEALIEDLSDYLIVPAGSHGKAQRAYVLSQELVSNLLDACALHHLLVRELIPETFCLTNQATMLRKTQSWLISLPGVFEGEVLDTALTPVLDSLFAEGKQLDSLTLQGHSLDALELLKTTLESSFPNQINQISCNLLSEPLALPSKAPNLLTGRFAPAHQEKRPAVWWKPLVGLAASALLLWTVSLYGDLLRIKSQANQVQTQSLALYKSMFPNERIRSLERQFREKLAGSSTTQVGFVAITAALAKVYAEQGLGQRVELLSLRYTDRMNELNVELRASNLEELEKLRSTLEQNGLQAEIASATNDKDGIRGRLRLGGEA